MYTYYFIYVYIYILLFLNRVLYYFKGHHENSSILQNYILYNDGITAKRDNKMQVNGTRIQSRVTAIKIQRKIIYSSYRYSGRERKRNQFNRKLNEIIIHTHTNIFFTIECRTISQDPYTSIAAYFILPFSLSLPLVEFYYLSTKPPQKVALFNFALTPFFSFPLLLILFYFPFSLLFPLICPLLS